LHGKDEASKPPPKKGSFLEILARAEKAQASISNMGKIQHKPLDKGPNKRERQEIKAQHTREAVRANGRPDVPRSVKSRHSPSRDAAMASKPKSVVSNHTKGPSSSDSAESKKVKKAALATTGYQGTARGVPKPTKSQEGRTSGSNSRSYPFGAPRRRRDEEDEEMDDFIEYDDDEDGFAGDGYSRSHMDEDESDMEAGLSDIDEEERRADAYARQEDAKEIALEAQLKRDKEARKRAFAKSRG
jgi:protein SPT2